MTAVALCGPGLRKTKPRRDPWAPRCADAEADSAEDTGANRPLFSRDAPCKGGGMAGGRDRVSRGLRRAARRELSSLVVEDVAGVVVAGDSHLDTTSGMTCPPREFGE